MVGFINKFQSTRPRGRTRPVRVSEHRNIDGFNPRVLAGGRDHGSNFCGVNDCVSIHASSREDATRTRRGIQIGIKVSIHASSREDATLFKILVRIFTIVSIHASSREDATLG